MSDLKQRTIRGILWSGIDQFGIYFIKFVFSIVIARLLSPEDYGIIGLITIFIAISTSVSDSGLQMALIQKKEIENNDYSTAFLFNLSVGLSFYLILFFSAELIADYFKQPILIEVIKVSALSLIIGPFGSIQITHLLRTINFKKQAKINFVATIMSGVTGILFAYYGYAFWALVIQTLTGTILRSIFLWFSSKWRPTLVFDFNTFKKLYNYGWKIFIQGLTDNIINNIYYPVIGKVFSAAELGFYSRAKSFYDILILQTTLAYGKVTFPLFSSIQDQPQRFKKIYNKIYRVLLFIFYPFVSISILISSPFIKLFLTEKWMDTVPYLQIFLLQGIFFPILLLNLNVFNALGRSDLSLKIDIIKKILTLAGIYVALAYGIIPLLYFLLGIIILSYFLSCFYIDKIISFSLLNQFKDVVLQLIISSVIFLIINFLNNQINNDILKMIIVIIGYSFAYLYFSKLIGSKPYLAFKETISDFNKPYFKYI